PNPRFWRAVLCQLSYTRMAAAILTPRAGRWLAYACASTWRPRGGFEAVPCAPGLVSNALDAMRDIAICAPTDEAPRSVGGGGPAAPTIERPTPRAWSPGM